MARWSWLLNLQAVFLQAGWIGARLMLGYRALEVTSEPLALGIVVASFAAPSIVVALPAGRLADRWGGAVVSLLGSALCLAACVAAPLTGGLVALIGTCVVLGLGQALFMVGQHSSVAERTSASSMDQAYGGLSSAISVGQLVGPMVVSAVAAWGASFFIDTQSAPGLFAAAGLFLLAIPVGVALVRSPTRIDRAARTSMGIFAVARSVLTKPGMWRALVVSGVVLAAVDLLYAFMPVWAVANDVPIILVGWLLGLRAVVTVVSRFWLGSLVRLFGRRMLMTICLLAGVAGFALLPLSHEAGAALVMIALGIALGLPQPLTISWVVSRTDAGTRGSALGLRVASNRVVQLVLPVVVGAVAAPLGVLGIFWGTALTLLATAAVTATAGASLNDSQPPSEQPPPE